MLLSVQSPPSPHPVTTSSQVHVLSDSVLRLLGRTACVGTGSCTVRSGLEISTQSRAPILMLRVHSWQCRIFQNSCF